MPSSGSATPDPTPSPPSFGSWTSPRSPPKEHGADRLNMGAARHSRPCRAPIAALGTSPEAADRRRRRRGDRPDRRPPRDPRADGRRREHRPGHPRHRPRRRPQGRRADHRPPLRRAAEVPRPAPDRRGPAVPRPRHQVPRRPGRRLGLGRRRRGPRAEDRLACRRPRRIFGCRLKLVRRSRSTRPWTDRPCALAVERRAGGRGRGRAGFDRVAANDPSAPSRRRRRRRPGRARRRPPHGDRRPQV